MKSKFKTLILCFLQVVIISYLTSCASTKEIAISKDVNISSKELGNRIPLKAGLYFSQGFSNAKYPIHMQHIYYGAASAGDALRNGSEKVVRTIFREALILEPLNSATTQPIEKYDVIVAPEILTLDYEAGGKPFEKMWCKVQTVIKWNIASPEGKEIYSSTIKSDEVKPEPEIPEVCIKQSIENNFQKAMEDLYTSNWWKKQWWKDKN